MLLWTKTRFESDISSFNSSAPLPILTETEIKLIKALFAKLGRILTSNISSEIPTFDSDIKAIYQHMLVGKLHSRVLCHRRAHGGAIISKLAPDKASQSPLEIFYVRPSQKKRGVCVRMKIRLRFRVRDSTSRTADRSPDSNDKGAWHDLKKLFARLYFHMCSSGALAHPKNLLPPPRSTVKR